MDTGPGSEDTGPPGIHGPRLDNTLPRVVGHRPRWWRRAARRHQRDTCVVLASATIGGRPLLAPCVGVVVGPLGRWRGGSGGPRRLAGRGRRQERRLRFHLLGVAHAVLFLEEIGLGVEEGWRRFHGGENSDRLAEFVVQTTQGVDDECGIGDGGAAVVEGVREALELAAILSDAQVALKQTMEVLLGVHGALKAVVEELVVDRSPGGVGAGVGAVDVVPDLRGDRVVKPGDDAGVDLKPFGVVELSGGIHRVVIMIEEAELVEGEFKVRTPLMEVARIGREDDGDMASDVEHHERGGRGWSGISKKVGARGG